MSIGVFDAVSAYGKILDGGKTAGLPSAASHGASPVGGFGDMVEQMVTGAASSMRAAESASIKQVAGKGDLIDVVTAIGAAETALETVVSVRDRMVSAYSEIMRMQI